MPLGGDLQDDPLDEELQVAEEDEGRRGRRPALVLLDEAVALELPDLVRVLLHLLERVAGGRQGARRLRADDGPAPHLSCPGGLGDGPATADTASREGVLEAEKAAG